MLIWIHVHKCIFAYTHKCIFTYAYKCICVWPIFNIGVKKQWNHARKAGDRMADNGLRCYSCTSQFVSVILLLFRWVQSNSKEEKNKELNWYICLLRLKVTVLPSFVKLFVFRFFGVIYICFLLLYFWLFSNIYAINIFFPEQN